MGLAFVPYFSVISYNVWESHFTVTRHALPFTLAFNLVLALRPNRRWLIWFLLGNCFVPYGIYRFVDFGLAGPQPAEFALEGAALPAGTVSAAFRDGWHGQEWKNHRTWRWSESPHATLVLTNAGPVPLAVHLAFSSESFGARDLRLSVRGVTVWSGPVASGPVLTPVATGAFLLPPGETVVDFSTAGPARLENNNPDARLIGFRVIGLSIAVGPAPP